MALVAQEMPVVLRWHRHVAWCTHTKPPKLPKPLGGPKGTWAWYWALGDTGHSP